MASSAREPNQHDSYSSQYPHSRCGDDRGRFNVTSVQSRISRRGNTIVRLSLKTQVACSLLTCADRPVVGLTTLLLGNQNQKLGDIMVPPKFHSVARSADGLVHVLYRSPLGGFKLDLETLGWTA
jgi:hypothetical protein